MPSCKVTGCPCPTTRWGTLCNTHKCRQRRHGHPEQRGVTKAYLRQYIKLVRDHVTRNTANPVWGQLDNLWCVLVDECARELAEERRLGLARVIYGREARQQLERLKGIVKPREAIETILAMFLMWEFEPRQFRSDDAFRFQLVRRVRGLSEVNAGTWYDHGSRRVRRVYRDLRPKATRALAGYLVNTFGRAGLYIAKQECARLDEQRNAKQQLDNALGKLK